MAVNYLVMSLIQGDMTLPQLSALVVHHGAQRSETTSNQSQAQWA